MSPLSDPSLAMHITVNCVQCSRTLRLPSETLGSAVKCPLCQATFLTRGLPNGEAEAIPIAQPGQVPPLPKPERPPVPKLSLDDDDDVPVASLARRHSDDEAPAPYRLVDDDPPDEPRRSRDDDRPRRRRDEDRDRPRRRDDDEDEGERHKSSPDAFVFAVLVAKDPHARLEGRFSAEVDSEGLRIWRGRGRVLEIPTGEKAKHLEGARISVPLEGRSVEFTVIEPEGRSLVLAEQVIEVLTGERDKVRLPKKGRGIQPWLIALPVGIPVLALVFGHSIGGICGGIGWGLLAIVASGLAALYVFGTSWASNTRTVAAGSTVLVGYLILFCGFKMDRPGVSSYGWKEYAGDNGGLKVKFPGAEPSASFWKGDKLRGLGIRMAYLKHPKADVTFEAGVGEFKSDALRDLNDLNKRLSFGDSMVFNHFELQKPPPLPGEPPFTNIKRSSSTLNLPAGAIGLEFEYTLANGRYSCVRVVAQGKQLMILCVISDIELSRTASEVRQFFDSASMSPSEVGQIVDAGPRPIPNPNPFPKPPVVPPQPKKDVMPNGGKLLVSGGGNMAWAGWTRDGRQIVSVAENGTVQVWDSRGEPQGNMVKLSWNNDPVNSAALSPDSGRLAVAGLNGSLAIVDLARRSVKTTLSARTGTAQWAVAWSPDGKKLATGTGSREVVFWDAETGTRDSSLQVGDQQILSLAYSPDGKRLAVGDAGRVIRVYDTSNNSLVSTCKGHASPPPPWDGLKEWRWAVRSLDFAADNRTLISASHDETARLWDSANGTEIKVFRPASPTTSAAFFAKGKLVAVGTGAGKVHLYDTSNGVDRGNIRSGADRSPEGVIRSLAFDGTGWQLVVAVRDRVELWEVPRRVSILGTDSFAPPPLPPIKAKLEKYHTQMRANFLGTDLECSLASLSRDGTKLVVKTSPREQILSYDARTLKLSTGGGFFPRTPVLALSPDGTTTASALTNRLMLPPLPGKSPFLQPAAQPVPNIALLAFSGDGKFLASTHPGLVRNSKSAVLIWSMDDRKETARVVPPSAPTSVALTNDGASVLVGVSGDGHLRVFDAKTGKETEKLESHAASVTAIGYSTDGKRLASGDKNGHVRLWSVGPHKLSKSIDDAHTGKVLSVAFSPDGKILVTAGEDKKVVLWDAEQGSKLFTFDHGSAVLVAGFVSTGKMVLTVTADGNINRYDLEQIPALAKRFSAAPKQRGDKGAAVLRREIPAPQRLPVRCLEVTGGEVRRSRKMSAVCS